MNKVTSVKISLQGRLLAAFIAVVVIAVAVVAFVGVQSTASEFGAFMMHSGMARSRPFAMMLTQYYAQRQSWDGAQALITDHAAWMGERTVLVDAQDVVVADSENALLGLKFNPNAAETAMDVQFAGRVVGRIFMNPSLEGARLSTDFMQGTARGLVFAGLAASLVAVLFSFLVARRITAPVRALTTAARGMAHGDLTQHVKVTSSDEIGELANAFNTMASSLERADQLRRNLVADVAHELRTPLTSVLGSLEAMRDGVAGPTPEFLASAYEEGLLLKRMVNDLQELSLAEAGQFNLDRQSVALSGIVERAVNALGDQAREKDIELNIAVPSDLIVNVDSERIGQVLRNLLTNAIAFTPAQGHIEISAHPSDEWVQVSVADTGVGIKAEDLAFIFERFYRADKSRTRATGGAGLGLAIAKQWVESHEGTIQAKSVQGQGTTIIFSLPKVQRGGLDGPEICRCFRCFKEAPSTWERRFQHQFANWICVP